ncbi:MAG: UvrD-helicase domain-containing protein, partial [Acidobacteriota bacterium]|nr:UvrD-helicase domain-containing protein [Acidobacteriota bacterium]
RLYRDVRPALLLVRAIKKQDELRPTRRDYDAIEASLVELASNRGFVKARKGSGTQYGEGVARATVIKQHTKIVDVLRNFRRVADADVAALLQGELRAPIEVFASLKRDAGRLDFVDLLLEARDLVRDHDDVRADFQRRFSRIFVDEFQDTDPLQAEILLLLSADDPAERDWRKVCPVAGKLFIVGDPKQSIYRFRRADVGIYWQVKTQLWACGVSALSLRTSFRAVPAIQRLVNRAFSPLMGGTLAGHRTGEGGIDYVALSPFRDEADPQPRIVVLPVPRPYGLRRIAATAIEQSFPEAVGAFVSWLITESGWRVTERAIESDGDEATTARTETRVPIAARHVCILFRRFESLGTDVTRAYVEALEARELSHLLVGGRTFHDREEVTTMRAALAAVEYPDDELSLYATLRGSLFAIEDAALLEFHHRFGRLHPFWIPSELDTDSELRARLGPIAEALRLLRDLHRRRNHVPVAETVGRLLEGTRAHAGFVMRPAGEQVLANVLQIAELARRYEAAGGLSFRGFIDQLEDEAVARQAGEAPILEEGSDGVRIMTVHRAKGLEFPVVILADPTCKMHRKTAGRFIDAERGLCALRLAGWSPLDLLDHEETEVERDRQEGIRLAYVAATRARDLLVVPAVGDSPYEGGWLEPLNSAIYPPVAKRRDPGIGVGCPSFGPDSVVERPDGNPAWPDTVAPGQYTFDEDPARSARVLPFPDQAGSASGAAGVWHESTPDARTENDDEPARYSLVWWDPNSPTFRLGVEARFGIRQQELLSKDTPTAVVEQDLARYQAWRVQRDRIIKEAGIPSLRVVTVTELAEQQVAEQVPWSGVSPEVVELIRDETRPAGRRFGAVVHAVLAGVPLDADETQAEAMAHLQGRLFGATSEEVQAAADVARSVLAHPLFVGVRDASSRGLCRREVPVTMRSDDGLLVEGVIDLAFRLEGVWVIVDFKTDKELETGLEVYRRQVQLYAQMVAQATGDLVRPILMQV